MNSTFVQKRRVVVVGLALVTSALHAMDDGTSISQNALDALKEADNLYCAGDYRDALPEYDKALKGLVLDQLSADQKTIADAHTNYGQVSWALGDYRTGHKMFDSRLQILPEGKALQKPLTEERLRELQDANSLDKTTLLVRAEYGLGDTFGFMKGLKALQDAGVTVILKVQNPLKPLLSRSIECASQVINNGDKEPSYDYEIYLMSVPRYTSNHGLAPTQAAEDIPHFGQYIHPLEKKISQWKEELRGCKPLGFCWAASANPVPGGRLLKRNIPLNILAQLSTIKGVRACNLQGLPHRPISQNEYDQCKADNEFNGLDEGDILPKEYTIETFPNFDKDGPFEDTAAVMRAIQILKGKVVSIDTSVPNLAGAITEYNADAGESGDTPVIMLLADKANIDARWGEVEPGTCGEISRLFNSVVIYSQGEPGDWKTVIKNLRKDLDIEFNGGEGTSEKGNEAASAGQSSAELKSVPGISLVKYSLEDGEWKPTPK